MKQRKSEMENIVKSQLLEMGDLIWKFSSYHEFYFFKSSCKVSGLNQVKFNTTQFELILEW